MNSLFRPEMLPWLSPQDFTLLFEGRPYFKVRDDAPGDTSGRTDHMLPNPFFRGH